MEKPEAKMYRAGLIKDLQSLKAKKVNWRAHLASSQKTDRYAEAKEIQNVVRKENRDAIKTTKAKSAERPTKTDSIEQIKSPEQLAAEIIEAITTDPNIEFAVDGTDSVLGEQNANAGIMNAVAGVRTGGKIERDYSDDTIWLGNVDRHGRENEYGYFDPQFYFVKTPARMEFNLSQEKMNRLFLLRKVKINTPSQKFSKLFRDIRSGCSFTIALSGPSDEKKIGSIKMKELRDLFRTRKLDDTINGENVGRIFDLLAMHYIPEYFSEMQRLAAEYKKNPWRT